MPASLAAEKLSDEVRDPPLTAGSRAGRRGAWRDAAFLLLLLASVLLVASPTIYQHLSLAADPTRINDDARVQIPPFLAFRFPGAMADDFTSRYLLDSYPVGFKATYVAASKLFDPRWFSKALPLPLWVATMLGVGLAARRLGGWGAAWVSMALVVTVEVFIERMAGGLARSFAFPLFAMVAAALAWGRIHLAGGVVVLAAAFYPATAVGAGLALALVLLALPRADRGDASGWSIRKRLAVLGGTAALCAAVYLPTFLSMRQYGPMLGPGAAADYPEIGPDGRLGRNDRPPFPLLRELDKTSMLAVTGPRRGTGYFSLAGERAIYYVRLNALRGLAVVALVALALRGPEGRRVATLGVAAIVGHTAARLVHPHLYLPERYTLYALPILVAATLPAGLIALARRVAPDRHRIRRIALVATFGVMLIAMGTGVKPLNHGLGTRLQPTHPVLRFIERDLPADSLVAGWPADELVLHQPARLLNDVPYMTMRRAFASDEQYFVFHKNYVDLMRVRTDAELRAYFAATPEPLARLRNEFGVTHLVIDRSAYELRPEYFAPYDKEIEGLLAAMRDRGPEVGRQGRAIVFTSGTTDVLDLSRIELGATAAAGRR